jgi:hypothetical protein
VLLVIRAYANVTGNNKGRSIIQNNKLAPQEQNAPSYFAVIPANVRYDPGLPPNAKLLYGEITALCNKKGFCWAGTAYFADLYGVCKRSVIQWINKLQNLGYINVSFDYAPGKKMVQRRRITLPDAILYTPPPPGGPPPSDPPPPVPDEAARPPEVVKKSSPGGEKIFTGVVKKKSPPGEKIFTDNITSSNTRNSSSSPEDQADQKPDREEEEPAPKSEKELKQAFSKIHPLFVFDSGFYPRAAAFLAAQGFSDDYLSWLYEFCLKQKPRTIAGLYYTLFFSEQAAELYRRAVKERAHPPPISCPVCGSVHGPDLACPGCGLEPHAPREVVSQHTLFWNLPDDLKSSFIHRQEEIMSSNAAFQQRLETLARLRREYGLA